MRHYHCYSRVALTDSELLVHCKKGILAEGSNSADLTCLILGSVNNDVVLRSIGASLVEIYTTLSRATKDIGRHVDSTACKAHQVNQSVCT